MPESPDFDTMAVEALISTTKLTTPDDVVWYDAVKRGIIKQLREVWNARGAADRATIDASLASQMGATASGPYVKNLDRAIRTLDR